MAKKRFLDGKGKLKLKSAGFDSSERTLDKCLAWFYAYPNSIIGLNDLSRSIGSSKTATKEVVESLVKKGLVNKDIIGRAWLLYTNQKNTYFMTKKIPYNLNLIYESGIVGSVYDLLASARAIVLFGSYRWGVDTEESDIDIAVEVIGDRELEIARLGKIDKLGYRKNVPVNLHIFSRNKVDLNLYTNIVNGIVLDGILEAKP